MSDEPTTESPNNPHAELIDPQITSDIPQNDPAPRRTPEGWYPTPDGGQRYWDGSSWTDLPWDEGDAARKVESAGRVPLTKWSRQRRKRALIVGAAVVIIVGLLAGGLALKGASDREVAASKIAKIHTGEWLSAADALRN